MIRGKYLAHSKHSIMMSIRMETQFILQDRSKGCCFSSRGLGKVFSPLAWLSPEVLPQSPKIPRSGSVIADSVE